MLKRLMCVLSVCLAAALATSVQAAELTVGPDADTYVISNDTTAHGDAVYMYLQDTANGVAYLRFNLAEINVSSVQNATLTLYTSGGAPRNDNVVAARFVLHGLNNVPGNTPQDWSEATLTSATVGAEYTTNGGEPLVNVTDLDDTTAGITETITRVGTNYYDVGGISITVTGDPLVQFLQSRVEDNGLVTFVIDFPNSTTGRGFGIASKENELADIRPVLTLTATTGARTGATNPSPANEAVEVVRDTILSWRPGTFANTHDVYLGTNADDVAIGAAGTLVGQGQDANSFDPGRLELGQTYYWRIDEVNAAPDFTVYPGPVWSFTVEAVSYPLTGVTATASSSDAVGGPQTTADGTGLTDGLHSTANADMWLTAKTSVLPAWIQYEFDRVYKLQEMRVWNANSGMEDIVGVGAKDVVVEYSTNGSDWAVLSDAVTFNQAPGAEGYAYNTTVDFAGAAAKYVKLTINSNWFGIVQQTGLSEVQFFYIPVEARDPMPASATTDVDPRNLALSWKPGREAASHQVYLDTDMQAVTDGSVQAVIVDEPTYTPPALPLGATYYWKIVEVNDVEAVTAWTSPVWSFSTGSFITIDDFESYTDDIDAEETIYQAWVDGWGDDTNGAIVGYDEGPFAEQTVLHGGKQSMPLRYALSGSTTHGEGTITFDGAQDWTKHGVTTLTIFFHGQTSNSPVALYAKINNTKISFNNGAAATALPVWKTWNIDLAATGASLKSVKSLTIGVEGTGEGTLFVDDIRLYAIAPAVIGATDPGTTGLVAWYKMDGNVDDSSGKKYNGTLNGSGGYDTGSVGQALNFNGSNTYVDLPIGPLMPTLTNATVATFVYMGGGTSSWERVFDFGTDSTNYMFLSPRQSTAGAMRFAIRTAAVTEQVVDSPSAVSLGWHHMAVSINATTMMLTLYLDGEQVGQAATTLLPKDLGTTTQNWLGRSQYEADGYFLGMLDEFKIYNKVLTAEQIRYLAGDR